MTDQGILGCYIEKIGYPGIHGLCYFSDEAWTVSSGMYCMVVLTVNWGEK